MQHRRSTTVGSSRQMHGYLYDATSMDDDYFFYDSDEAAETPPPVDINETNSVAIENNDEDEEFRDFANGVKEIEMSNIFAQRRVSEYFRFGDYVARLTNLLDANKYKNESLKTIVNFLMPPIRERSDAIDDRFVERLVNFTTSVIEEPRLETACAEIILLFNLLHSPKATIGRDADNASDIPTLIGNYDIDRVTVSTTTAAAAAATTGYRFPSRTRYVVSLDVLDVYETSCKPEALQKRIRHPSYREKCKASTVDKYSTPFFLDSLKTIKPPVRNGNTKELRLYEQFLIDRKRRVNVNEKDDDIARNRRKIIEDIEIVQNYPALRQSLIENTITKTCKISLSIERYVATRTGGSMDNENYRYPCFLHFITL